MQKLRTVVLCGLVILGFGRLACGQPADAQKLHALKQALDAGVISQEEYDTKVAQLKGAGVDATNKQADASLSNRRTKTVAVVDSVMNMPAFRVTVPKDWSLDGAVLRSECGDGVPFLTYRAYSPDKLSGIQLLPQADWYSAADSRAYQSAGVSPCHLHAPARAAEVAAKIATDLRAGAQVLENAPTHPASIRELSKSLGTGPRADATNEPPISSKFSGHLGSRHAARKDPL